MLKELIEDLNKLKDKNQAEVLQRFFKTGKGEYGEGDVFLGIKVPVQRKICKKYDLELNEIQELLNSKIHEYKLCGLLILINRYKKAEKNPVEKIRIFEFYIENASKNNINNWDLVDLSAPKIAGEFLLKDDRRILKNLAKSDNIWERRIAIVSTMPFVKNRNFGETLSIADILINDEHDLIHKAVGWMLREIGKKNENVLEIFLATRYKQMPRTMLRYAIEKFPEEKREKYLRGEI
ncbi:MAG TPA: DNA alkylation repair protein [Candidatus Nanoarchaeia archaeon]|nr:DNA alkylation repair protein [Candidatus Nanoarchaeia archaeon]